MRPHDARHGRDDRGSVLPLVLVLVIIAGMFVVPLLGYATGVLRNSGMVESQTTRAEAVKASLRIALQDATKMYAVCSVGGATTANRAPLAPPPPAPGLPSISINCGTIAATTTNKPGEQRWAMTVVQAGAGAAVPAPEPDDSSHPELNGTIGAAWCTSKLANPPTPCGRAYPGNGATDTLAWQADIVNTSTNGKVFVPFLPTPDTDLQPASGFVMPSWNPDGPCRVFFPGRYIDDVVLDASKPTYFVSGIYYFEKSVTVRAGATVVVGTGSVPGCVDSDSTAALSAIDEATGLQPRVDQVNGASGVGGTFVFGRQGRLVFDNATGAGTLTFLMNRRVEHESKPEVVMNDVSIVTVNGVTTGSVTTALDIPGQLNVPAGAVFGTFPEPSTHEYSASTLISPAVAPTPCVAVAVNAACPVVELSLTTANEVDIQVPGYVAIPQGSMLLDVDAVAAPNASVSFSGGVVAAQVAATVDAAPTFLQWGIVETIVQRTFIVEARTTSGQPEITGSMILQVNESGGYDINSFTVERS